MSYVNGRKAADERQDRVFGFDRTSMVRIPVNKGPISDIAISRDGSRLVVTNYGSDSISVVDADGRHIVGTLPGLNEPFALAMGGADRAYVSTVFAGSMAYDRIDVMDIATGARIATHELTHSVSDLTVSPDEKYVYGGRNGTHGAGIAIIDTTTGEVEAVDIATAPGTTIDCARISPDGRRLYVGANDPFGGNLVVVEVGADRAGGRSRIGGILELGLPVRGVALSPDGGTAYVASWTPVVGAVLDVIDTRARKITSTCKVGDITAPLTRLTLSNDGGRAYLVSDDRVTVLCTATLEVLGDIRAARHPSSVVESLDGRYLAIADYTGVVTVARVAWATAPGTALAPAEANGHTEPVAIEPAHVEAALV